MPTRVQQEQYGRFKALFVEAAELHGSERDQYLQRVCGSDTRLRDELAMMLASADQESADGIIEAVPSLDTSASGAVEKAGDAIGPYILREMLGEGGFGSVWVAEQSTPVKRKVALKILKAGMDTRRVIARFQAEQQALALMEHPGIARVLDAGATPTGRPYFVMELVRGMPITRFCQQRALGLRQRIDLIIQACEAVQHAHTKGIIHRDLKPGNILVSDHDGATTDHAGTVKIIDFGIAKAAAGQRLTDATVYTELRGLMGTPAYMSPEQAGLSDLDVDTRSDVFALGIVLYELLAGKPPLDARAMATASIAEVLRLVRDHEAEAPSTSLARTINQSRAIADLPATPGRNSAEAFILPAQIRGELDWIVLRAIERDRARRYQSPTALADDLRRYLAAEPVLARPASIAYTARKFIQRHKGLVAALLAVLATGAAGFSWAGVNFFEARRQRDAASALAISESAARAAADAARLTAEVETQRSVATQEFLLEILRAANVNTPGKKRDVTVAQALDSAVERLDAPTHVVDLPVDAKLRKVIAVAYLGLGVFDKADTQSKIALDLARKDPGNDGVRLSEALGARVAALWRLRREEEARPLAIESLKLATARAEKARDRGIPAEIKEAELDEAEANMDIVRLAGPKPTPADIAAARRCIELNDKHLVPDAHRTLSAKMSLCVLLGYQEKYDEALPLAKEIVAATRRETKGPTYALAQRLDTVANLTTASGDPKAAVPIHEEAIAIATEILGPDDSRFASLLGNQGHTLELAGMTEEAAAVLIKSFDIFSRSNPTSLAGIANGGKSIGDSLIRLGKPADAAPIYLRGSEALAQLFPDGHARRVEMLTKAADAFAAAGDPARAEAARDEAAKAAPSK